LILSPCSSGNFFSLVVACVVSTLSAGVKSLIHLSTSPPDKRRKRKLYKTLRIQPRVVAKKLPISFTCLSNLTIHHKATDTQRKKILYLLSRDWKHRRKLGDETERNLQELEQEHVGHNYLFQDTDQLWPPFVKKVKDPAFHEIRKIY
jgi:hypothetical protein